MLTVCQVAEADRLTISRLGLPNTFRITVRYGYMENVVSADLWIMLIGELRSSLARDLAHAQAAEQRLTPSTTINFEPSAIRPRREPVSVDVVQQELALLDEVAGKQSMYIVGKEDMRIPASTNFFKKVILSAFLFLRDNTRTKVASLNLPVDRLVELGFVKEFLG